ncbi:oxidoreductase [Stackebrandtia nassauensis]|uniref:Short-chain dehydrogenase/reductase SDR n=1 Tax=Stackebrandtia nassauensis (strain DSM 44728 / CIP 108903 / NRRL B-16338 / NBRC 102104 / LLR-40K-21) TaxID=446470 RepID=D3QBL1_STANL|nr:oxidoreductase [Stackebrandtia nassauensis]ADD42893.1 short-chain dehydrogenase/reductase SDR [Stackebrandtia nassauensis DSM 44728]
MTTFNASSIGSQAGRTFVVTGANSGIGRIAAKVLAERDARVVLAVRDEAKGRAAAATMTGQVEVKRLDLADLASVRAFAEDFTDPIDVLVNNAGVMIPPLTRTADGFELQFGTNHLGHFALTNLLLPQVRDRVVTVASMAHHGGAIDFDDLNWQRKPYRAMRAYGQSKLANLLFTTELQRRLSQAGSSVIATAAHPGFAATNLLRPGRSRLLHTVSKAVTRVVAQSEAAGALPTLYAAVTDVPGDSYAGPKGLFETRGAPKLVGRSAAAKDAEVAKRLWEVSQELTAVVFPRQSLPRA